MAYQMAAKALTLNDFEGHSQVAGLFRCNPSNIVQHFTRFQGEKSYAVPTSVMFVLFPGRYGNFTQEQCEDIGLLKATFEYVQLSERRL